MRDWNMKRDFHEMNNCEKKKTTKIRSPLLDSREDLVSAHSSSINGGPNSSFPFLISSNNSSCSASSSLSETRPRKKPKKTSASSSENRRSKSTKENILPISLNPHKNTTRHHQFQSGINPTSKSPQKPQIFPDLGNHRNHSISGSGKIAAHSKQTGHRNGKIGANLKPTGHRNGKIGANVKQTGHRNGKIGANVKQPGHRNGKVGANVKQTGHRNGSSEEPIQVLDLDHNVDNFTPVGKRKNPDCATFEDNKDSDVLSIASVVNTPPIEASESPEIECFVSSAILKNSGDKTPCYSAGHILSGISDKRKSRPIGVLTVGPLPLLDASMEDDKLANDEKSCIVRMLDEQQADPLVPLPAEATEEWFERTI